MSAVLPKNPVRVSPTIKLGRWVFLALGIMYGSSRHNSLEKREAILRAAEEKERPAKEAAAKAEKDRIYQNEVAYLRSIGVDLGATGGGGGGSSSSGGSSSGGGGGGGSSGGGSSSGSGPAPGAPDSCIERTKYKPTGFRF